MQLLPRFGRGAKSSLALAIFVRLALHSVVYANSFGGPAIGIDLGDLTSVITSFDRNGLRVLTNKLGGRSTPSAVVFGGKFFLHINLN
jgi:hypothetical protein